MKFHYDKKVDAFYIRFSHRRYAESDEVKDDVIFDYDSDGRIIGIEILNASNVFPLTVREKFSLSQTGPLVGAR